MARAYSTQEMSDPSNDPRQGEWHALRGELVALLDQVEGRYARVERPEPAFDGLSQRQLPQGLALTGRFLPSVRCLTVVTIAIVFRSTIGNSATPSFTEGGQQ